jgi:NifB/MoaA-like Fe-S oxidoreductase
VIRRRLLRNPRAPAILPQLQEFAQHGIRFHTQIVLQPGVNDGEVLQRSLDDLYRLGDAVLSVAVVPLGLTAHSDQAAARPPTAAECGAAITQVHRAAERAAAERGIRWAHGSDELYLAAGRDLPPAEWYEGFEQVENGVGSVRYLERRLAEGKGALADLSGRRIAVLTGTAMGRLMPPVLETLARMTAARFELIVLENDLFGPSVTTAALLPGRAFHNALRGRTDLDLALIPAESINDDGRFLDDVTFASLARGVGVAVRPSYHFSDALSEGLDR